jgi:hypothetical protein
VNNDYESMYKESVVTQFKVPSVYLSGGTKKSNEKPHPAYAVSGSPFRSEAS